WFILNIRHNNDHNDNIDKDNHDEEQQQDCSVDRMTARQVHQQQPAVMIGQTDGDHPADLPDHHPHILFLLLHSCLFFDVVVISININNNNNNIVVLSA